eukprot:1971457-Prymnesium_polylepis.2
MVCTRSGYRPSVFGQTSKRVFLRRSDIRPNADDTVHACPICLEKINHRATSYKTASFDFDSEIWNADTLLERLVEQHDADLSSGCNLKTPLLIDNQISNHQSRIIPMYQHPDRRAPLDPHACLPRLNTHTSHTAQDNVGQHKRGPVAGENSETHHTTTHHTTRPTTGRTGFLLVPKRVAQCVRQTA